jgi:hypothetical protein
MTYACKVVGADSDETPTVGRSSLIRNSVEAAVGDILLTCLEHGQVVSRVEKVIQEFDEGTTN